MKPRLPFFIFFFLFTGITLSAQDSIRYTRKPERNHSFFRLLVKENNLMIMESYAQPKQGYWLLVRDTVELQADGNWVNKLQHVEDSAFRFKAAACDTFFSRIRNEGYMTKTRHELLDMACARTGSLSPIADSLRHANYHRLDVDPNRCTRDFLVQLSHQRLISEIDIDSTRMFKQLRQREICARGKSLDSLSILQYIGSLYNCAPDEKGLACIMESCPALFLSILNNAPESLYQQVHDVIRFCTPDADFQAAMQKLYGVKKKSVRRDYLNHAWQLVLKQRKG